MHTLDAKAYFILDQEKRRLPKYFKRLSIVLKIIKIFLSKYMHLIHTKLIVFRLSNNFAINFISVSIWG